uniref:G_PROTEIN_RECEP_F1_2 domain-containing protein n=1 Tax=Heterorhabditis bacteriophora TaxID=37862 RepID=A0A1I7X2H8_HETBA
MAVFQQTYCIDYNGWISVITELFQMETLAAGLLSTGLTAGDALLICGCNHSQVEYSNRNKNSCKTCVQILNLSLNITSSLIVRYMYRNTFFIGKSESKCSLQVLICALAAARAGLVFSLTNPNFANADMFLRALKMVKTAVDIKRNGFSVNFLGLLITTWFYPLGTYTLSEIYGRSSTDKVAKLPKYKNWSSHKLACRQFTMVNNQGAL